MRVVVVGAGAVGSFLGGTLALAGVEVTLVSRTRATLRRERLTLVEPDRRHQRTIEVGRAATSELGSLAEPDLVLLTVRQLDLASALDAVGRWPAVPVVTAQNGIGAEAAALDARPGAPLVAASLTASVELVEPDRVLRRRRGGIGLAAVSTDATAERLARSLADAFRRGGLPAAVFPDAAAMKWSKLVANLVGNATSAVLDLDPSAVYADPRLFTLERRQLREALAVMDGLGLRPVSLPGANVRLLARGLRLPAPIARPILARVVRGARGGKAPSLRLGVRAADAETDAGAPPARTEAAWLNGAVASEAVRLGIAAPVNAALARLVDETAVDPDRRAFFRGRPERLLSLVPA